MDNDVDDAIDDIDDHTFEIFRSRFVGLRTERINERMKKRNKIKEKR